MRWIKTGLVFTPDAGRDWMRSHAQVPLADRVGDDVLRVYFGTRDAENRTVTAYVEVAADDPRRVLRVCDEPALGLGRLGCFDDRGALPSWVVNRDGEKLLYYVGWNVGGTVPFRNSIGLAASRDGGRTFARRYDGPVVERIHTEPHFCATSCVLVEGALWRMWYLSCTGWEIVGGQPEPRYHIKYAESADGVVWERRGVVAVELKSAEEGGLARPCVVKTGGLYRMWYSYRGLRDYRTDRAQSYRIGYAESADGISWTRMDEEAGIDVADAGWDSEMVTYAFVYEHGGRLHMLYNGNGFGATGFGHAVAE